MFHRIVRAFCPKCSVQGRFCPFPDGLRDNSLRCLFCSVQTYTARYDKMYVSSESDMYKLDLSFKSGVPPDDYLSEFSGQYFSTYDNDWNL